MCCATYHSGGDADATSGDSNSKAVFDHFRLFPLRNNSIQFDDDHELGEIDFGNEGDGDAMDGEFDDFDISAELEASMRLYGEVCTFIIQLRL